MEIPVSRTKTLAVVAKALLIGPFERWVWRDIAEQGQEFAKSGGVLLVRVLALATYPISVPMVYLLARFCQLEAVKRKAEAGERLAEARARIHKNGND
jgi:hypothetical protein